MERNVTEDNNDDNDNYKDNNNNNNNNNNKYNDTDDNTGDNKTRNKICTGRFFFDTLDSFTIVSCSHIPLALSVLLMWIISVTFRSIPRTPNHFPL